jgi:iron(III) transport system substrate-binding protein
MLAVQDSKADANYFADLAGMAKGGLTVQSSTGTMMERVSSGENLMAITFWLLRRGAGEKRSVIGHFISERLCAGVVAGLVYYQESAHPNAARLWLDYVLSEKGQSILANQADIPSIRNDIEGKNDIDGMTKMLGNALKPIPVNETLLEYLQPQKRLEFIKQWRTAAAK